MFRFRSFSIVFHNVKDDSKPPVERYFDALSPVQLLVALEPYPQDEGHHIHVFVSFKNPRQFKVMLDKCIEFSAQIVAPKPEGEVRDWGRVQVDQMRGTFEQATKYLTDPNKDKEVDPDLTIVQNPSKFEIKCDVCGKLFPWIDTAVQYMTPQGLGRCRPCSCAPHRMFENIGIKVRNLDKVLGFDYDLKIRSPN
jgi:hypothetical protein